MDIKKIPVSDVITRVGNDPAPVVKTRDDAVKTTVSNPVVANSEKQPVNDKQLEEAIDRINKFLDPSNNSIAFSVDKDTNITVVKVIDKSNNEVIRQMPTEEALAIAKDIDKGKGFLLNTKA